MKVDDAALILLVYIDMIYFFLSFWECFLPQNPPIHKYLLWRFVCQVSAIEDDIQVVPVGQAKPSCRHCSEMLAWVSVLGGVVRSDDYANRYLILFVSCIFHFTF